MIESIVSMCLMVAELYGAVAVFGGLLEKKPHFFLRFFGSLFVTLELVVLITFLYIKFSGYTFSYGEGVDFSSSVFKFFFYIAVFAFTIVGMKMSFQGSWQIVLFYASGAYAGQHLSVKVASFLRFFDVFANDYVVYSLAEAAVCAVAYVVFYLVLVRGKKAAEEEKDLRRKVFSSIAVVLVCIGLSRLTTDDPARGTTAMVAETIYAVVVCLYILGNVRSVTETDFLKNEMDIMRELLHREKEQYRLTKENIEIINIKCHDLKHQINALRGAADAQSIRQIEDAVMIYDCIAKTGNDVLDIILTEKSLYCEKNDIRLTCVVNGSDLCFMEEMDVYSLFGNAVSNAVESTGRIADPTRRCITINMQTRGNVLSLHFENYFDGELEMADGLPQTKKDKDYHGFGMKSMAYIARKYGGNMSVVAKDGKFMLDFLFPLTKKGDE